MPDFVRLTNNGATPFDFHQNNVKQIIPPGSDKIVPWSTATSLFGNPGVINVPPENARKSIYDKLRGRFNFQLGFMTEEHWDEIRPKIAVSDLETGEDIKMIYHDPAGEFVHGAPVQQSNAQSDVQLLQNQVAALTAQIGQLVNAQMAAPAEAAPGTTQSVTATADSPGAPVTADAPPVESPSVNADGPDGVDSAFGIAMPTVEAEPSEDSPGAVPVGVPENTPDAAPVKKLAAKKVAASPK